MSHRLPPMEGPRPLVDGGASSAEDRASAALLGGLAHPPPDDLAVERVWRRLSARPSSRPRGRIWAAGLALAVLSGVALLLSVRGRPSKTPAELAQAVGGVFFSQPAETWRPGAAGQPLREAQRVRTDGTGRAVLRLPGVAAVLLASDSDLAIEQLSGGTFLRLSQGSVTARVTKRPPGEPFVIQTDRYAVRVVGTLFTVEQGPGDRTAVSVREGVVEVAGEGEVYRVKAGTRWVSEAAQARGVDETDPQVQALLEGELRGTPPTLELRRSPDMPRQEPVGMARAPDVSPAAVASAAARSERLRSTARARRQSEERPNDERAVLASRGEPVAGPPAGASAEKKAEEPEGAAEAGLRGAEAAAAWSPPLAASSPSSVDSSSAAAEPHASSLPGPLAPPDSRSLPRGPLFARLDPPASLTMLGEALQGNVPLSTAPPPAPDEGPYHRALSLEAKGDFRAARAELMRAVELEPSRAPLALYALGRLEQHQLRNRDGALAAFRRYRESFPGGPLLAEVDLSILELEVAANRREQALAESTRFLASHPASERADEVQLIRANLLRDSGDWRQALESYQAVQARELADEARYSEAYCLHRLGDLLGARRALGAYLEHFPQGRHRAEAVRALGGDARVSF